MPSRLDKENVRKNLENVLDRMRGESDPALLNEYRKLFKKEVSLFRRSWAAAWLLMYYDQREAPRSKKPSPDHGKWSGEQPRKGKSGVPEDDKSAVGILLPEEESKRLFISIGRNRRLYPREILALIGSKTSISGKDIGVIRILDNYSFVQVRDTKADEIIEALNGLQFRGRTLAVNYAKSKTDEGEA